MAENPHVLVIVQNLPVPLDRRVWLECQALTAAGYEVSVICPRGPGDPSRSTIEGVHLYKYRPAPEAHGVLGYLVEFVYSWVRTALLSRRVWRRRPFDAIQACNPPDTYWALARWWKRRGVAFVFDQHDLNPELFLSRFGEPEGMSGRLQLWGLRWLERRTYATADHVISTNESYKRIAIDRGGFAPDDVTVVRSGPDTTVMRPVHRPESSPPPGRHTLAYLGIMGPQDGVDTVLHVMDELVHRRGRTDVQATLMGFGDCLRDLQELSRDLDLDDLVTFTGRVGPAAIAQHLSAAAVGLCPDQKTPLNDVSTMNKTMEYMAYAVPSVSFDLAETRVSGGDSCLYVPSGDIQAFADAVERLLDDPDLRFDLARRARRRVSLSLDWKPQSVAYVRVYDQLLRADRAAAASDGAEAYVDLGDELEFRAFVLGRGPVPEVEPVPEDRAVGA
ncbi:glycosyltransferase family 4 protein [Nocardioides sp. YIM 152315]|uniref:glycosyltransferase family 4 protein n=1 Tax=Nocardioides sp. YIM 152315 TaxID=3031760 RepID=UPI0023D990FB|nr:glycosyltransferase family 4 protein [Nocardioides sp. YIM 152315]MDF1603435.1 glycosyltransferase family 4 protein [Nocardioides sp. YIM 152315]